MNQGPPEDMHATDLWLALTKIPRPSKTVAFPRKLPGTDETVGELAIWPLTQEEQMAATVEADRFVKKLMRDSQKKDEVNLGYETAYANEMAIQVLYRACRDPSDVETSSAFPSPGEMRKYFSADEVGVLFKHYLTVQLELGPIVTQMSDEEFEAWIKRIEEGGSAFPFDLLSWEMQRHLLRTMASKLVSCWTAMSSAGLRPAVMPPNEESTQSETPDSADADPSPEV